jgi:cytochrome c oxidase subunit 1
MALGFFLTAGVLIQSLVAGKRAVENPWGAATLEWRTATPPIVENFEETPDANEPYDYSVNRYNPQTGNFDYVGPQSGSGHHGRRAGLASAESHS